MPGRMISFVVLAALASAGCPGDGKGIAPSAACEEQQENLCERVYACFRADELSSAGFPASEAACVTRLVDARGCAHQTVANVCVGNAKYHPDQAALCAEQIAGLACSQVRDDVELNDVAPACGRVCAVE